MAPPINQQSVASGEPSSLYASVFLDSDIVQIKELMWVGREPDWGKGGWGVSV